MSFSGEFCVNIFASLVLKGQARLVRQTVINAKQKSLKQLAERSPLCSFAAACFYYRQPLPPACTKATVRAQKKTGRNLKKNSSSHPSTWCRLASPDVFPPPPARSKSRAMQADAEPAPVTPSRFVPSEDGVLRTVPVQSRWKQAVNQLRFGLHFGRLNPTEVLV